MTNDEIRALRDRHRLSRSELAKLLGVSQQHVAKMERGERQVSTANAEKLAVLAASAADQEPGLDALPEPPYDPAGDAAAEPEPAAAKKTATGAAARSKAAAAAAKQDPRPALTLVQREAAQLLTVLIRGQEIPNPLATDGSTFAIPGLCHGIYQFACPHCALIVGEAAPAFSSSLVRAYPVIARMLARPGDKAELAIVVVQTILIPCMLHHLHPLHSGANGASPEVEGEPAGGVGDGGA